VLGGSVALRQRSLWIAAAVSVLALLLALGLARRLTRPLAALTDHVRRVGSGDFDARLDLGGARELRLVSGELNTMAAGLKERVEMQQSLAVAMEVQQSLLPLSMPRLPGLDVAGQSRYCDATGGDYFDFVHASGLSARNGTASLVVAVGDVMGHGVGAALLMASARAALRSVAALEGSLGTVMTRVNDVLAKDNRHERFMTMCLAVLDPAARFLRYASGGHDPILVYDPDSDTFADLAEGEPPLGMIEGLDYAEYARADLPPRAVVFIGTDGIWEATNAAKEQFGKDRLRALIRRHANDPAAALAAALEREHADFLAGLPIQDDVTFVVVRLTPLDPMPTPPPSGTGTPTA
jgi:phosphoserine phosphatase RsbU/P